MALFSKYNLDLDLDNLIKPFLNSHKQKELHATENPKMLEELSPIILQVLKNNNPAVCHILCSLRTCSVHRTQPLRKVNPCPKPWSY